MRMYIIRSAPEVLRWVAADPCLILEKKIVVVRQSVKIELT